MGWLWFSSYKTVLFLTLVTSSTIVSANQFPNLWEARNETGQVVYLMGTQHYRVSLSSLPSCFQKSFIESDKIFFEAGGDIESKEQLKAKIFSPEKTQFSIGNQLDLKTINSLRSIVNRLHPNSNFTIEQVSNWTTSTIFRVLDSKPADLDRWMKGDGHLDYSIKKHSKDSGKNVIDLEPRTSPLKKAAKDGLDSDPNDFLYLRNVANGQEKVEQLSDAEVEARYLKSSPSVVRLRPSLEKVVFTDRNEEWVASVLSKISDKPVMMVMGNAHIHSGKFSVAELFRKSGFSVQPARHCNQSTDPSQNRRLKGAATDTAQ